MALPTPSTQEIYNTIVHQIELSLGQTASLLPKAFIKVLAKSLAGVQVQLYKYSGFIFLQLFVSSASMRETLINGQVIRPLVEWGRLIGVGDPHPATQAELELTVTVENQTGFIPSGAQLLYPATGVVYLTVASVALDAPTVTILVRASSDQSGGDGSGAIGNLDPGAALSFASPLPNVKRDAVVASHAVTGADAENEEAYRARIIRRFRRRPQGGAYADYQTWAEEPAGILNVYPYTGQKPGEVDVYVEATVASSGSVDGIPTAAQLLEVSDSIQMDVNGLASRRPVNAAVNVYPISRVAFDVHITGLSAPDIGAAMVLLIDAIDEHFRSREPFIVGLSLLPRADRITQAAVSGVADDVISSLGGSITSVEVKLSGVSTPAYTLGDGEKASLGNLSYTI